MWRKTTCAVGGLFVACATAYCAYFLINDAAATTFESRWQAGPNLKGDRISGPRETGGGAPLLSFSVPAAQTSVIMKPVRDTSGAHETRSQPVNVQPVRVLPPDTKRKDKLPVGCEPSFSPVTTPAMANVSGRCLS